MESNRTIRYADLNTFTEDQLLELMYNPLTVLASCDTKLKYNKIAYASIEDLYPAIDDSVAELPDVIGYRLIAILKDNTKLMTTSMITEYTTLGYIQAQYRCAEQLLEGIE